MSAVSKLLLINPEFLCSADKHEVKIWNLSALTQTNSISLSENNSTINCISVVASLLCTGSSGK